MSAALWNLDDVGEGGAIPRIQHQEMPEFDITAMVDLVFMMNIYFLVTFVTVALGEVNLPSATHVTALDADSSVVITLKKSPDARSVFVYLGDGDQDEPLKGAEEQELKVQALVEQGLAEGKTDVLLKAEKNVRLGDTFRIATAAASVEGMKLHVAVVEKESAP